MRACCIRSIIYNSYGMCTKLISLSCYRSLEHHYPYFPSEKDFTHNVLSCTDIEQNNIALLTSFALEWHRLQTGGELLPHLVELYQWLHTNLAYIVSYEMACKVKIKSVIDRAVRKYTPKEGDHLRQLFDKVKGDKLPACTYTHNTPLCSVHVTTIK